MRRLMYSVSFLAAFALFLAVPVWAQHGGGGHAGGGHGGGFSSGHAGFSGGGSHFSGGVSHGMSAGAVHSASGARGVPIFLSAPSLAPAAPMALSSITTFAARAFAPSETDSAITAAASTALLSIPTPMAIMIPIGGGIPVRPPMTRIRIIRTTSPKPPR